MGLLSAAFGACPAPNRPGHARTATGYATPRYGRVDRNCRRGRARLPQASRDGERGYTGQQAKSTVQRIEWACLRRQQGSIVAPALARPGAMPDNRVLDPGIRTYL